GVPGAEAAGGRGREGEVAARRPRIGERHPLNPPSPGPTAPEFLGIGPIEDPPRPAGTPHPLTGKAGPEAFGADRNVVASIFTEAELEAARRAERLTPYDTIEVLAARVRKANYPPEWKNTWSNQTPERQAWRQEQIDAYYGTGAPRKERQAFLVIGTPAAGKSSAIVRRIVAE